MNPLMRFYPNQNRQFHGLTGEPQRQMTPAAQQMPQQPQQGGLMGGSQGLFNLYMSQLFNQKYAPPMMQGSPLQSYGGFFGFGSPKMNPVQAPARPQQPAAAPGYGPGGPENTWWDTGISAGA